VLLKVFSQFWQVLFDKHLNDVGMLVKARQPDLVYVSKLALLNQLNEQPESEGVRAVH
jgi:hypothetical protein